MTQTRSTSNNWLISRNRRSQAVLRLLAVPPAGSGAGVYHQLGKSLPAWVELWSVAAPGREHRLSEQVPRNLAEHVTAIATALTELDTMPLVLFGHSMGGCIAFELARALRDANRPLPRHLLVSAYRAPSLPAAHPPEHLLPPDRLLAAVRSRYGGFPPEVEAYPEVMELALDVLRGDLIALEAHRYRPADPLPLPITALGGTDDPSVTATQLAGWERETTRAFAVRRFPGTHRYLEESRSEVVAYLRNVLRDVARSRPLREERT